MLSKRVSQLDASGIRKVFDLAGKLANPVNLSIGQPDFAVPHAIQERAIEAIREGKNHYTVTQGIEQLRGAIGMRLDENRAKSQLAMKAGGAVADVTNVAIWGNHSNNQYPDFENAKISGKAATDVIADEAWLKDTFIPTVRSFFHI